MPRWPQIDDMLMMLPPRCSMRAGRSARVVVKVPRTLIDIRRSNSSSVTSVVLRAPMFIPALLTRMSTRPYSRSTAEASSFADAESRTSRWTPSESVGSSSARFSAAVRSMSAITMFAPSSLSFCAQARPMPLAPPVTTATLPSRSDTSVSFRRRWAEFMGAVLGRRVR